ncbi:MAG: hypothetical protein KGP29_04585 [Proteobacteria bacterium]|nr:hypothetical protein [Pseudomonadota bacterium]
MSKDELSRLIILGAGASVDCGMYPTGSQFVEIAERIISGNITSYFAKSVLSTSLEWQINREWFIATLSKLIEARPSSIDSYISSISDERERGLLKSLIVAIIIASTAYSRVNSQRFKDNWYFSIWQLIEKNLRACDDDKKIERLKLICGRIKIITFNYDVSLEMYLLQRLKQNFSSKNLNLLPEAFKVIVDEMITHVYGRVAGHEEIFKDSGGFFDEVRLSEKQFSSDREVMSLGKLMKENEGFVGVFGWRVGEEGEEYKDVYSAFLSTILVVMLSIKDDLINAIDVVGHEREAAKKEINNLVSQGWDLLYILGYGFDEANNQILHLKDLNWKGGCFVTNYAVSEMNVNQRLERVILDDLLSRTHDSESIEIKSFKIPLISHKTVSEALKIDFGLLEKPKVPIKIRTSLTPYLELKK